MTVSIYLNTKKLLDDNFLSMTTVPHEELYLLSTEYPFQPMLPLMASISSSNFENQFSNKALSGVYVPILSVGSTVNSDDAGILIDSNPFVGTLPLLLYPGPDNTSLSSAKSNNIPSVYALLPSWISSLSDAKLKSDLSTAFNAKGSISTSDMANLFKDLAGELNLNSLSSSQLADLISIASNISSVSSTVVAGLTNQLIVGNKANLHYTNGGTMGNLLTTATASATNGLKVGDTATNISNLNAKWFLGTDLPSNTFNAKSYNYASVTKDVFGSYGSTATFAPSMNDINQGAVGDCYFECTLAEVAHMNSSIIASMITDDGNGIYSVRFYVNGSPVYVTVNKSLLKLNSGSYALGDSLGNNATYVWASLVEKAYAQLQEQGNLVGAISGTNPLTSGNSYNSIGNGGPCAPILMIDTGATIEQSIYPANKQNTAWSSAAYFNLSSSNSSLLNFSSVNSNVVTQAVIDALARGNDVTISSNNTVVNSVGKSTLIGAHALSIYGYDPYTNLLQVRNPWGGGQDIAAQSYATTFEVSVDTLLSQGDWIYFDNASSPSPIVRTVDQVIKPGVNTLIKGVSVYYSSVAVPNNYNPTITAVVSDKNGLLTVNALSNVTVANNNTTALSLTGSLNDVNQALITLKDNNPGLSSNTTDDIFVTVTDSSSQGNTYTGTGIVGLQVNYVPTITVGTNPMVIAASTATKITGISIADTKATPTALLSVQVSDTQGILSVSAATGLTVTGSASKTLTLKGTLTTLNTALATLSDTNTTVGADNITVVVSDPTTGLIGTAIQQVNIQLPPSILPSTNTVLTNISSAVKGLVVTDAAATDSTNLTVAITNNHGLLNVTAPSSGLTLTGANSVSLTLTGTLAVVNTALATLVDKNSTAGTDSLIIKITDLGNSLSSTLTEVVIVRAPLTTSAVTALTSTIAAGSTINSAISGDSILIKDATSFNATALTVPSNSTLNTEVIATMSSLAAHKITWFTLGGNTYVLEQAGASNAAFAKGDALIELTGLHDLSQSSFNLATHTLTL
jgi:Calpain family cysteine protease